MKKFLLNVAVLALAIPAAQAVNVTLQFEGGSNAYKNVMLMNLNDETSLLPTGNTWQVDLNGGYMVGGINGATVTDLYGPDGGEQEANPMECGYQIVTLDADGAKSYMLGIFPLAEGKTFTVVLEGLPAEDEGNKPIYVATGNNLSNPAEGGQLTGGEETDIWEGTFTFAPGAKFRLLREGRTIPGEEDMMDQTEYLNVGPSGDTDLTFNKDNTTFTGNCYPASSDFWQLTNTESVELSIKVDMNTTEVTFTCLNDYPAITVNFTGSDLDYDANVYVQTYAYDAEENEFTLIENDQDELVLDIAEGSMYVFNPVTEGVTMNITSGELTAEELMAHGVMVYRYGDTSPMGDISAEEISPEAWVMMFMGEPSLASGLEFNVDVTYVEPQTPIEVGVTFVGENLPEDMQPYSVVKLLNGEDLVELTENNATVAGFLPMELFFSSTDEDYIVSDIISDVEDAINLNYNEEMKRFDVTIIEACNLTVTVEPNFTLPVGKTTMVTLKYIAPDDDYVGYECVATTPDALTGTLPEDFLVDSDNYMFICTPSIALNFDPYEGYFIKSITSDILDDDSIVIAAPAEEDGQWGVTIGVDAPEAVTFEIAIALAGSDAINGINASAVNAPVYNLQGVKVAESLNGVAKGIYIVGGKKVAVK